MKNSIILVAILCLIGCQKDQEMFDSKTGISNSFQKNQVFDEVIQTELVVYYKEDTTEEERQTLRDESGVIDYKLCRCADPNLELWIFDDSSGGGSQNGGGIEEKRAAARTKDDIENADYSMALKVSSDVVVSAGFNDMTQGEALMVSENNGVTIAVMDTGLAYDYNGFTDPFLYNTNGSGCENETGTDRFGWNFVHDSNNPYDDHSGKHGTMVTSLISGELTENNISHQILPIKVADEGGNISYFDLLCGLRYVTENEDVDIVNLSFGFYGQPLDLLYQFMNEVEGDVLFISSAGNDRINTDVVNHYPSSFDLTNILSVGASSGTGAVSTFVSPDASGSNGEPITLAKFSNFGNESVDIAAWGMDIPISYNGQDVLVSGTSFSTAHASRIAAALHNQDLSASDLKSAVISACVTDANFSVLKYSAYLP